MTFARHLALVDAAPFRVCAKWLRVMALAEPNVGQAERLDIAADLMDRLTDEVFPQAEDRQLMKCIVELGHPSPGDDIATWRSGVMTVCDRHRAQYDERPDLGTLVWTPIGGTGE